MHYHYRIKIHFPIGLLSDWMNERKHNEVFHALLILFRLWEIKWINLWDDTSMMRCMNLLLMIIWLSWKIVSNYHYLINTIPDEGAGALRIQGTMVFLNKSSVLTVGRFLIRRNVPITYRTMSALCFSLLQWKKDQKLCFRVTKDGSRLSVIPLLKNAFKNNWLMFRLPLHISFEQQILNWSTEGNIWLNMRLYYELIWKFDLVGWKWKFSV